MVDVKENRLRQIRHIIYALKRAYGVRVTLLKPDDAGTYNLKTGQILRSYTEKVVRKCIVLTGREVRKFVYDLSYIAANKNFTYGGFFDINERLMIVDKKDLKNFAIDLNCVAIYNSRQYKIKENHPAERDTARLLIVRELESGDSI